MITVKSAYSHAAPQRCAGFEDGVGATYRLATDKHIEWCFPGKWTARQKAAFTWTMSNGTFKGCGRSGARMANPGVSLCTGPLTAVRTQDFYYVATLGASLDVRRHLLCNAAVLRRVLDDRRCRDDEKRLCDGEQLAEGVWAPQVRGEYCTKIRLHEVLWHGVAYGPQSPIVQQYVEATGLGESAAAFPLFLPSEDGGSLEVVGTFLELSGSIAEKPCPFIGNYALTLVADEDEDEDEDED